MAGRDLTSGFEKKSPKKGTKKKKNKKN